MPRGRSRTGLLLASDMNSNINTAIHNDTMHNNMNINMSNDNNNIIMLTNGASPSSRGTGRRGRSRQPSPP